MVKVKWYLKGSMGKVAYDALKVLGEDGVVQYEGDHPDIVFSASWGKISQSERSEAKLAAVNIHTGLLPEGRGYHPLNWAIIWGKEKTGVTIHKMTDTIDGGDILLQEEVEILKNDTITTLRKRVEDVYVKLIAKFFSDPSYYISQAVKQNQAHVSYAQKRTPDDSELNLLAPSIDVYNLWRSCDPEEYPAFAYVDGVKKIVGWACMQRDGKCSLVFRDGTGLVV